MSIRQSLGLAAMTCAIALSLSSGARAADTKPQPITDQPIRIVVPYTAGGTVDVAARMVANVLQTRVNQTVMVENKPGGGGNIGEMYVAHAPGRSPTLLVTTVNHYVNPVLFKDPGYKESDFVPIAEVSTMPYVFVVPADSPFKTLSDIADWARKNPGKLAWGYGGIGSAGQFFGIEFEQATHVTTNPIAYHGGPDLLTAIGGGQVQMVVMSADTSLPLIKAGKLRAIATTGAQRNAALPNIPTASEALPSYEPIVGSALLLAPKTMPREMIQRIQTELTAAMQTSPYQQYLARAGATAKVTTTLDASREYFDTQDKLWQSLAKTSGVKVE